MSKVRKLHSGVVPLTKIENKQIVFESKNKNQILSRSDVSLPLITQLFKNVAEFVKCCFPISLWQHLEVFIQTNQRLATCFDLFRVLASQQQRKIQILREYIIWRQARSLRRCSPKITDQCISAIKIPESSASFIRLLLLSTCLFEVNVFTTLH